LIREFFTHADENPHGWGLADFSTRLSPQGHAADGEPASRDGAISAALGDIAVIRSPERADTDPLAAQMLSHPVCLETAIAHIRKATIGQVELGNCHPFVATDVSGRTWTLTHKGTVFNHPPLDRYFYLQSGTTDSERILLALIDRVNEAIEHKAAPLEAAERFEVFDRLARELSLGNCVNLLVYDSDLLYAHRNYRGALHYLRLANGVLLCTSKLASATAFAASGATWKPVPLCTTFAYAAGKLVHHGEPTGNQYLDNELDTRYLYWDFAGL
jgi:glutamine amidotransferase